MNNDIHISQRTFTDFTTSVQPSDISAYESITLISWDVCRFRCPFGTLCGRAAATFGPNNEVSAPDMTKFNAEQSKPSAGNSKYPSSSYSRRMVQSEVVQSETIHLL